MPSAVKDKPQVSLKVEIPGSAKALSGSEGDAAALELGLTRISKSLMQQMADIGIEVERAGIVHTDRGYAFGTKEVIWELVQEFRGKIKGQEVAVLCEIAGALGKCAKGIGLLSGKNLSGEDKPQQPAAPRISFAPGQQVIFNVQHEAKPA